jgi:hypothetical protein
MLDTPGWVGHTVIVQLIEPKGRPMRRLADQENPHEVGTSEWNAWQARAMRRNSAREYATARRSIAAAERDERDAIMFIQTSDQPWATGYELDAALNRLEWAIGRRDRAIRQVNRAREYSRLARSYVGRAGV